MYAHALDSFADYIAARIKSRDAFEEKYGTRAGTFLSELRPLFLFYRRLPFEFALPASLRHLSATAALYIAEQQDFLADGKPEAVGLIDDVYAAFVVLPPIMTGAEGVDLNRHWRGDTPLDDVVGLAQNIDVLRDAVPMKVRENLHRFLGVGG